MTACCLLQPHIDSSLSGVVKVLEKKQEDEENLIEKEEEMVKKEKEKETMKEALSLPVVDVATDIKVMSAKIYMLHVNISDWFIIVLAFSPFA